MDESIIALKKVVKDWGVVEIVIFVVFIPWSFLYLALRVIQEYDSDIEEK